jgi:hypothetical protein
LPGINFVGVRYTVPTGYCPRACAIPPSYRGKGITPAHPVIDGSRGRLRGVSGQNEYAESSDEEKGKPKLFHS